MKMRRFSGSDMRDALRQVREALGPDAVILETNRTAAGVEITAAVDGATGDAAGFVAMDDAALARRSRAAGSGEGVVIDGPAVPPGAWYQPPRAAAAGDIDGLRAEVQHLRGLLEDQLARLVWDRHGRQSPELNSLLRHLAGLGLETDVARTLADRAIAAGADGSWSAALRTLVEALPVWDRELALDHGIYAIVGPTGAGKTTTIAKLASRAALQFGAHAIGLITTDTFRVAAREQLETYGQILGVPVHQVSDGQGLTEALRSLRDRRLVLVDTAGMSQRDPRLNEQLLRLTAPAAADFRVETLLALPANLHPGTLRETVTAFGAANPVAAILTKTDEATSLGAAYSVLIRAGLPIACVANGQRVPEDLHDARGRETWLAKMAVELMRRDPWQMNPDEDQLARRYREVAVHACA